MAREAFDAHGAKNPGASTAYEFVRQQRWEAHEGTDEDAEALFNALFIAARDWDVFVHCYEIKYARLIAGQLTLHLPLQTTPADLPRRPFSLLSWGNHFQIPISISSALTQVLRPRLSPMRIAYPDVSLTHRTMRVRPALYPRAYPRVSLRLSGYVELRCNYGKFAARKRTT